MGRFHKRTPGSMGTNSDGSEEPRKVDRRTRGCWSRTRCQADSEPPDDLSGHHRRAPAAAPSRCLPTRPRPRAPSCATIPFAASTSHALPCRWCAQLRVRARSVARDDRLVAPLAPTRTAPLSDPVVHGAICHLIDHSVNTGTEVDLVSDPATVHRRRTRRWCPDRRPDHDVSSAAAPVAGVIRQGRQR